jgi:hypothetical protein
MAEFARLGAKFFVHSVTTELAIEGDSGHFAVEIHYVNRIVIDGSTDSKRAAPSDLGDAEFAKAFDGGFSEAFAKGATR